MISDFTVTIDYKEKDNPVMRQRVYRFDEYTNILNYEIKRIISEVEDAFIVMNEGKSKDKWREESLNAFNKIRHHLLDQANAVGRLPRTLHYKGTPVDSMTIDEWLKGFFKSDSEEIT